MQRYDQQQSTYLPDREQRFTVMLDVLDTLLPKHFVALDLAGELLELYRQVGVLVRPGGVFLNGDGFGFAPHLPSFNTVTEHGHAQWTAQANAAEKEDWEAWWEALRREPEIEPFFA